MPSGDGPDPDLSLARPVGVVDAEVFRDFHLGERGRAGQRLKTRLFRADALVLGDHGGREMVHGPEEHADDEGDHRQDQDRFSEIFKEFPFHFSASFFAFFGALAAPIGRGLVHSLMNGTRMLPRMIAKVTPSA